MGVVSTSYFEDVLHRITAPVTDDNLRACHAWQVAEGGNAQYNSWNTTEPEPGDSNYNSFGTGGSLHVRNYPTQSEGVDAIVRTLLNGDYPAILSALRRGNDGHAVCVAVDASVWGTHGAAATYLRIYGSTPTQTVPGIRFRLIFPRTNPPFMQGSDVRQVQEALNQHGYHLLVDGIYGSKSANAVRLFEVRTRQKEDGIVGPHVRAALGLPH